MALLPPSSSKLPEPREAGTFRPRVTLQPGCSLMNWINLGKKKLLASTRLEFVDEKELSKHNMETDCWVLLGEKVYDVTKYLPFHPGGANELMRAAGRDGTFLFAEVHGWVNYETLLQSCYVGKFTGDRRLLEPPEANSLTVSKRNVNDLVDNFLDID